MKSTTQFKQNKRGVKCLNCKQPISDKDNFCSNCGQVNDELPLSIKQFVSEFFSGFFSFDTRFFNTFVPLLFKPGKVSRDYVEGKRRRYVNPFQLYLHVTIVFFLVQGLFSVLDEYKVTGSFSKKKTAIVEIDSIAQPNMYNINHALEAERIDTIADITKDSLEDNIAIIKPKLDSIISYTYEKTKFHIDSMFKNTTILKQLNNKSLTKLQKDSIFDAFYDSQMIFSSEILENDSTGSWNQIQNISKLRDLSVNYVENVFEAKKIDYDLSEKYKVSIEDSMISSIVGENAFKKISNFMTYEKKNENISALQALEDLGYEKTRKNIFYYKKAQDFNKFKNDSNFRKAYLDSVISKISIALFFMLPIFTGFLALLYIRHKKNYTEHLVFVFNVQTVFFILLIVLIIFDRTLNTNVGKGVFTLVFLFYLYKSLRNFYKQNRTKTLLKFFMLNSVFVLLSFLGFMIISFLAFAL